MFFSEEFLDAQLQEKFDIRNYIIKMGIMPVQAYICLRDVLLCHNKKLLQ